jgi:predicted nucleotidyltransferase
MNTPPIDPDREALLRALQDGGVSYVLIGGAALETHRQPHRTDDVDIAPAVVPLNLERDVAAMAAGAPIPLDHPAATAGSVPVRRVTANAAGERIPSELCGLRSL